MGQFDDGDKEFSGNDSINSLLNLNQFSSPGQDFDVAAASQNDFLDQMFSSLPPSTTFPWVDSYQPPVPNLENQQPSLSPVEAKALLLQQQFQLGAGSAPMCHADQNDVVDGVVSFPYPNLTNDVSVKGVFNGFEGSLPQNTIQSHHFSHHQPQNYGTPASSMPVSQPGAIGSSSGATAAQPRQRVRARRGQATDPHSIAERLRRERIAERMKALQELVPNANKMDKASMLDEIIDYVKFLQLQVKVLSVSRLGGGAAAAVAPSAADFSHEGRGDNGGSQATSAQDNEGVTATEQQVAKLMEEDMGAAMQYLQGKGLCLMPISLATVISSSQRSSLFNGRAAHSSSTVGEVSTVEDPAD